jgi:hypothetical protein
VAGTAVGDTGNANRSDGSADPGACRREPVRIAAHGAATPTPTTDPVSFLALAADLKSVWTAPSTDARLKKRIVRTVIHEVIADIDQEAAEIALVVHWIGGTHPLPDGPWIFSRAGLSTPAAQTITERARRNPRRPAGSHPDQQSLFPSLK